MGHDASKVLLGTTQSSFKTVDNHIGAVGAGKVVCLTSGNALSTTLAAGSMLGVSLGKSLSDTSRTAICRRGTDVPVLLGDGFTPTIGAQVQFHATDGTAVASGTPVNAIFSSSILTGIDEAGAEVNAALIDYQGGL